MPTAAAESTSRLAIGHRKEEIFCCSHLRFAAPLKQKSSVVLRRRKDRLHWLLAVENVLTEQRQANPSVQVKPPFLSGLWKEGLRTVLGTLYHASLATRGLRPGLEITTLVV